jgi:hypothetical protein
VGGGRDNAKKRSAGATDATTVAAMASGTRDTANVCRIFRFSPRKLATIQLKRAVMAAVPTRRIGTLMPA